MSRLSELKYKGPWYWNEKRLMLVLQLLFEHDGD